MSADDNNDLPPEDQNTNPPPAAGDGGEQQPQSFSFDEAALEDPEETALNRRGSSLGGGSGKAVTLGAALLLGTGIILYYLFSDTPPPPKPNEGGVVPTKPSGEIIAQPSSAPPASVGIATPAVPTAPPAPPPPPPPPPPPAPPAVVKQQNAAPPKPAAPLAPPEIKAIAPTDANAAKLMDKRAANRMRSNMLLMNGGKSAPGSEDKKDAKAAINQNDPNAAFADNVVRSTEAETVTATRMSNMHVTIAQGKIINAVLETALNTDLPGTLRAIISRDVYAEAGKNVLIPKGSRLIGTYNTGIFRGQKRVLIVWTRVITPEGIDMMIGSPGIDSLGRAGVQGQVDNKFMESFSAAILTSMITLGVGIAADNSISGNNTSTTNTDGSSTTTGSAGAAAIAGTVRSVGDVSSSIVNSLVDLRPTITIDQGTRINVFVNQDVLVPAQTTSGSMFVQ